MAHINIQPPGVIQNNGPDRNKIVKVIGGDSWHVSVNLFDPVDRRLPATPSTTLVEVVLSETQFDKPLWTGEWYKGVTQDSKRADLCHIDIPRSITKTLRRGSYQFSVRVSDLLKTRYVTEADGSFLVEYKPTSDQHSIPYKDGTSAQDVDIMTRYLQNMIQSGTLSDLVEKTIENLYGNAEGTKFPNGGQS